MLNAKPNSKAGNNMKKIKLSNNTKGILYIIAAAFGFSLMTFFVKLSGDVPTMQKAFFRNAFAAIVATILVLKSDAKFKIKKENYSDLFFRCLFGTSGLICNFYAVDHLNIADANMLNKLSPFFAILISIPLLKEIPNSFDIFSVLIAFIGALFIIRPFSTSISLMPALLGLYGGFGAGTAYAFVRKLGKKRERTEIIVLIFSLFSSLVTLPFLIFNYSPMTLKQLFLLILAGIFAAIGQLGITSAYKYAPAKNISVFDYTQVIFAALLGIMFLGEIPVLLSIIGYIIIISAAILRWRVNLKNE